MRIIRIYLSSGGLACLSPLIHKGIVVKKQHVAWNQHYMFHGAPVGGTTVYPYSPLKPPRKPYRTRQVGGMLGYPPTLAGYHGAPIGVIDVNIRYDGLLQSFANDLGVF